jgi:sugar O-acyltransferase (sialic acid O-acetyltransferase NeuD family)
MKKIAIYGAGGFGKETHQLIDRINSVNHIWEIIGFLDDRLPAGTNVNGLVVLGGAATLKNIREDVNIVFAIAAPQVVEKIKNELTNPHIQFPNLIHPSVEFELKYNEIGIGNVICFGCHFTRNIKIGDFNLFNSRVTLGHDVKVGSFNVFQPNVQVSGEVEIGSYNYWGLYASVLQRKKIGNCNTIGAGSILMRNVKDNASYFGNPAIKLNI